MNWTREEDRLLLDCVDEMGNQWARICSAHFPERTDHACLFRYNRLMEWRRKNEWLESQPDDIREFILFVFRAKSSTKKTKGGNGRVDATTTTPTTSMRESGEGGSDDVGGDGDGGGDGGGGDVNIYTKRGQLVPDVPKFGLGAHNLQNIMQNIYEKQDLVSEFVQKKRNGQLSLSLLTRIGIYTPILNSLISNYKKKMNKTGTFIYIILKFSFLIEIIRY